MRIFLLIPFFVFNLFANTIDTKDMKEKLNKPHLKSLHGKQLSKEEIAYQEYKVKLEEENQKLEDDGFCSCNND